MNTATDSPLFTALRDCGRIPADQMAAVEKAFVQGGDPGQLADRLVATRCLTRYQHRKIQLGRASDLLFGPYLVLERVGEGGMGKVYRAIQVRLNRLVALKTIRPNLLTNKTVISRYRREARAAAALDHPNIVKLFEADDVDGRYYLAMEFVEGMDLSRLTKDLVKDKRSMPPAEAAEYIRQAALGLAHAHERGLVHRDIKPSNVLVSGERAIPGTGGRASVKLLDMGLVRSLVDEDNTQMDLTRDGTVVGTPDYMSPEQAKNSSTVDHRADIYSLGCTMFYLLRGQPPYSEGTAIDKLIRHQLDPVPDIRQYRPDVPPGLAAVIRRTMAKKPDDRFQWADELARELAVYADEGGQFDFAAPNPGRFQPVDLASAPAVEPKSNDSLSSAPAAGTAAPTGTAVAPSTGHRTVKPVSPQPVPGQRTVRPLAPPPPQQPVQVVRTRVIAPRPADASPSDSLPGADANRPADRSRTPISGARPRRGRRPNSRRKSTEFPVIPVAVAGAVIIAVFVVAAVIMSRGNATTTPSTRNASVEPAGPSIAAANRFRPIGELVPDRTAAILVATPQAYWEVAQFELPLASQARGFARFLFNRFQFDPWRFDRVLVALPPGQVGCVAVGEGGPLADDLDQFRKNLDAHPREVESDSSGATLVRFRPLVERPRVAAERRVRAALLPPPAAYLVGTPDTDLTDLVRTASARQTAAGVDPLLLAAVSDQTATPQSVVQFAATGAFQFPLQPGGAVPLADRGVELLTLRVQLDGKQFRCELAVAGPDFSRVRQFLADDLPNALEVHCGAPAGGPLANAVRSSIGPAVLTDDNGLKKLTARFTWDWADLHTAAERVIPVPHVLGRDP